MAYNKKAHLRDNIEAIRLMFRLEKEQRTATPEEAGILAAYSGFGGIKAVLSPFGKLTDILRWTQADRELFPLITELHNVLRDGAADEREYKRLVESVKASTFTAFYTPPAIIDAIASSLGEHGVSPGRFLDPSSGTGNFVSAFQPQCYSASGNSPEMVTYEKDLLTGRILSRLHPEAQVNIKGFEELPPHRNGYFDVVSSNIPFGDIRIFDPSFDNGTARRFALNTLHNYFFVKGLDAVREGGILAFITSQGVMNSAMAHPIRQYLTKDGTKIGLYANIGNMSDLSSVLFYGASGIGLLRSEFQYIGRENYPRENELFHAYKKLAETMGERTAVIRTADLGADKQASYLDIPAETNPIMGNRGIRLCLDRKKMFKAQLRAIYRASAYGNLAMMYPMIDSEEEMDQIEEIIQEVKAGLDEKEIPYRNIRTGIMIETPAAVMISQELARRVNFLSIGTNDLTQYTLAMDRQNPLLKDKYNDHHPAVLRMIKMVVEAAHQENRQAGICGEIAADTELTETFLQMGVDFLSVVPACILPVRKAIRETDLSSQRG